MKDPQYMMYRKSPFRARFEQLEELFLTHSVTNPKIIVQLGAIVTDGRAMLAAAEDFEPLKHKLRDFFDNYAYPRDGGIYYRTRGFETWMAAKNVWMEKCGFPRSH
jgi:hypothetical protein